MGELAALARAAVRDLRPYTTTAGAARDTLVALDTNELPAPGSSETAGLERYPDPDASALRDAVAGYVGVTADRVLLTRGGDEVIESVIRTFCEPGRDRVVVCPPCFAMYGISARLNGVVVETVLLDPETGQPDVGAIAARVDQGARVVFLCAPNNPTGVDLEPGRLDALASAVRGRAVIVVDEAYVEFADRVSFADRLRRSPNLVVLRTFSKAHGLAGIRVGYAVTDPELVALMRRTLPPYPIPTPCQDAALAALDAGRLAETRRRVRAVRRLRARLASALTASPRIVRVYPSEANFLLLEPEAGEDLAGLAEAAGLRIRRLEDASLPAGSVRVSVGDASACGRLVRALGGQVALMEVDDGQA